ncbi:LutC/YkgG family protein [Pirellulimonas nuda]|nr:LUD domain-containing protein [Pirellulimonas nuda]
MTARETILEAVRRAQPEAMPLPALEGDWIRYDDPVAQFCAVLEAIGSRAVVVGSIEAAQATLEALPEYEAAQRVFSAVEGIGRTTLDANAVATPHELASLEVAILPGELAVAENGAVWVTDLGLRHRVTPFICELLVLVVPKHAMVHTMHEAYQRISAPRRPDGSPAFGVFIAGPSKTADIEQSLVIGAHGPKESLVLLTE